ncbi:HAD-IIIC family phosphatase [Ruficoccus amylovorans]|uniref:HAD-IIIC family phosphatase n=1 Tax=Ruficoccus amylovorans TaxID=1804625 RepID=A0A842HE69_9BACT|nr:HAD-IIIC family phosphatase [Ruficoccus amylovorans]MBC2594328.1 HAD-IIIC family phosphatase [Ruficoccus amylovorans]
MLNLTAEALSRLDTPALTALLRAAPEPGTVRALWAVVKALPTVDLPLAAALLDVLAAEGMDLETLESSLEKDSASGTSETAPAPMVAWLQASLLEQAGETDAALSAWKVIAESGAYGHPGDALLAVARLQLRTGHPPLALATLREALRRGEESYGFWSRADRLARKLLPKFPMPERPLKIALLGSSTTTFYAATVRVAAVRDGFFPEIYEAPFGTWRQEILSESSGLYAFAPDVVVLATHWRDAGLATFAAEDEAGAVELLSAEEVPPVVAELKHGWGLLRERLGCPVIQHSFDLPAGDSGGALGANAPGGRIRCLRALNERLRREAPPGVAVLDLEALAAGAAGWVDPRQWYMHKQHPALDALPALANACLGLIRAVLGLSRKVLVLDLDNTLWGGVIGEDGLAGIRVGPPQAEGEAYAEFQRYARELKERGILLAVCSKNNEADARLPFEKHDGMVLGLEDFAVFVANWEDKPVNLRRIAETLNVGLDSFVFVDDNPVERARVRQELPQVAVPEIGADPAEFINILAGGRWFEALTLSEEDRVRHAAYQANAERRQLEAAAPDLNTFLRQLRMRVSHGPITEVNLERVAQLVGKTNQFNLTTRRHPAEALRRFAADPAGWTRVFRLKDRYGDNGLVGVVIATAPREGEWEVDTFLMSCRVIGRGLADYMVTTLLRTAAERGIRRVTGLYIPTEKNALVADFYFRSGFAARLDPAEQTRAEGPRHFVFEVGRQDLPAVPEGLFTVSE